VQRSALVTELLTTVYAPPPPQVKVQPPRPKSPLNDCALIIDDPYQRINK
jgi:hypothetical protein